MELEGLFSSTRWEILSLLSAEKLSPMEIADQLNTTSANISQQLRLLELAGLVKSERTRESDKKKPRVLYFLADDYSYLVLTSKNYAQKKLLPATDYSKYFLKSLFVQNEEYHKYIGMFYWTVQDHLDNIMLIAIENTSVVLKIVVIADNKSKEALDKQIKKSEYSKRGFKYEIMTKTDFDSYKSKSALFVLYDPQELEGEQK